MRDVNPLVSGCETLQPIGCTEQSLGVPFLFTYLAWAFPKPFRPTVFTRRSWVPYRLKSVLFFLIFLFALLAAFLAALAAFLAAFAAFLAALAALLALLLRAAFAALFAALAA